MRHALGYPNPHIVVLFRYCLAITKCTRRSP